MAISAQKGEGEIMDNFALAATILFGLKVLVRLCEMSATPCPIKEKQKPWHFIGTILHIGIFIWGIVVLLT